MEQIPVKVGIAYPLTGPVGFTSTFSTESQTKYNLLVYLITLKGERVFNPTFGTNLNEYLFEPNSDNIDEIIKNELTDDLNLRFSSLANINVILDKLENQLSITIQYQYIGNAKKDQVTININE